MGYWYFYFYSYAAGGEWILLNEKALWFWSFNGAKDKAKEMARTYQSDILFQRFNSEENIEFYGRR